MANNDTQVAVIGGGAAGIAAGRRLQQAAIDCLVVEARPRLGGRAWSVDDGMGNAVDLGCGWLHSADRNPWVKIAEAEGYAIDKSMPPWQRRALPVGFPPGGAGRLRQGATRLLRPAVGCRAGARPVASDYLEPGNRWNNLINAHLHLYQRRRCRPAVGQGFRELRRQREQLARGRRLRQRGCRLRQGACASRSIARCCRSITPASG